VDAKLIDVWDVQTFDFELIAFLEEHVDVVRDYLKTDHQIFLSHDLGRGPGRSIFRPENPHALAFHNLQERVDLEMQGRTIRAFHYTRLTDGEVAIFKRDGIHLSTSASLRHRFDDAVAEGSLTRDAADQLYAESAFHSDQLEARSGKFWMTSHPTAVDDRGVEPLMRHWGGEVASIWIQDETLSASLASLGKPRIVEVAVPMNTTRHSYNAAQAVVATFARSHGSIPGKLAFDLFVDQPLPATAILAVHTEGDAPFAEMGRSYPAGFVNVDIGHWKELTDEEKLCGS
jgi:hypothetical protein